MTYELDFESNDTTFDIKAGMEKYRRADITRLRKLLDGLKDSTPKRSQFIETTKLINLMGKIGFDTTLKYKGSHRPFYHKLLCDKIPNLGGRICIASAHGKQNATLWADFNDYVLDSIEYVLDRIESENLILGDDENV